MSLSKQEIGTIIIRVIGIYALIQAFGYYVNMVSITILNADQDWLFSPPYSGTLYFIITVVPLSVIGTWFLSSSAKLGSNLVGKTDQSQSTLTTTATDWEVIALSTIGYYLFFDNLPRIINVVSAIATYHEFNQPFPTTNLITTILMFLLSIWLILRARGFIGIIHKIRNAGFRN